MRVEPYTVDSYVHAIKRGARGLSITRDISDKWRFVRLLYYLNDEFKSDAWDRETFDLTIFERPNIWPSRKPLVKILAWTLMPNHFHLLLKEIQEGGISKFLQKLCGSMSVHFNRKYDERGSVFQGAYKSRTVGEDRYMRYLASYIMVKNVFELYPGGYEKAVLEFDIAWQWAVNEYKFSSLADYVQDRQSSIIEKDILGEFFSSTDDFYKCSKDMILGRVFETDIVQQEIFLD